MISLWNSKIYLFRCWPANEPLCMNYYYRVFWYDFKALPWHYLISSHLCILYMHLVLTVFYKIPKTLFIWFLQNKDIVFNEQLEIDIMIPIRMFHSMSLLQKFFTIIALVVETFHVKTLVNNRPYSIIYYITLCILSVYNF